MWRISFGIAHTHLQAANDDDSEICSAVENDPMVTDVYDEEAERKTIGGQDSARGLDLEAELLDIDVSKGARSPQENNDQTVIRRKSLRRTRNISAVDGEQSVAQNIVTTNTENKSTDTVCSKLVRRGSSSFVEVETK